MKRHPKPILNSSKLINSQTTFHNHSEESPRVERINYKNFTPKVNQTRKSPTKTNEYPLFPRKVDSEAANLNNQRRIKCIRAKPTRKMQQSMIIQPKHRDLQNLSLDKSRSRHSFEVTTRPSLLDW